MTSIVDDVNDLREELRRSLDATDRWLRSEPSLSSGTGLSDELAGAALDEEWLSGARQTIRQLKVRASSSLINVAFVGGYSSGKSFLIGALQNRLEYEPVEGSSPDEIMSARYIGLLFSAPQATTACPATIVPVDATEEHDSSGRGFLRVRFADNLEWEDVGNSPPPAVVAAYTTQNNEIIINRLNARHREQQVAEVEILLTDSTLPAKLYDLPGHGSLAPIHDEISNRAWADADCIVFTTQATHSLSMADDELISRLHSHHLNTGKKIIWVVTGIDRANVARNLSDNKVAWQETVDADNEYLRQRYPVPYGEINRFLGPSGFIAVSPAWEAYGKWLIAQGNGREAEGRKYVAASRMSQLRQVLTDLIETGAGHRHIALIAREARSLVTARLVLLKELLDTARTPLDELAEERDDLFRRLRALQSAIPDARDQLNEIKKMHVRKFREQYKGLAEHLHTELDDMIKQADLTKEKAASAIDRRKSEVLKDWTANRGPDQTWNEEYGEFVSIAQSKLQIVLGETRPADGLGSAAARIDVEELMIPPSERYRTGAQDILGQVSMVVGVSTPVLGSLAAAAGLITGPFLAIPAGITVAAGLVYGVVRWARGKSDALDLLRKAWIQSLNEQAEKYEQLVTIIATGKLTDVVDRATEILSQRETELSRKIVLTETSLADPGKAGLTELVARLDPFCDKGDKVVAQLTELVSVAQK